ncbi:unnamed protein product [Heligmosomoides polygyrus]|uniref:DOG1 domain-containing protein n=1 Tax=Heligmosomoides polygyrus TaxID=6339 RepID=A0A183FI60_HELPZ|nr:unnamed protein product [Heligmosomoides polygyrus]
MVKEYDRISFHAAKKDTSPGGSELVREFEMAHAADAMDTEYDENRMFPQVSSAIATVCEKGVAGSSCVSILREMQRRVSEILNDSRLGKEERIEVKKEIAVGIARVEEALEGSPSEHGMSPKLVRVVGAVMEQRGIDSVDEWRNYLRTMERDGELMAEVAEMLNTDVLQVKEAVAVLQKKSDGEQVLEGEPLLGLVRHMWNVGTDVQRQHRQYWLRKT